MYMIIVTVVCLIHQVSSHAYFRAEIPNGFSVPNPCPGSSAVWNTVGHFNPLRFTPKMNPFDDDFTKAGFKWTRDVCHKDSDRDGRTNGEELGDPHCTWTKGANPHTTASGHPGICQPLGSTQCQYQHFHCDCLEKCPGLVATILQL